MHLANSIKDLYNLTFPSFLRLSIQTDTLRISKEVRYVGTANTPQDLLMTLETVMLYFMLLPLYSAFLANKVRGQCTDVSIDYCGGTPPLFGDPTSRAQFFSDADCGGQKLDLDAPGEIPDLRELCRVCAQGDFTCSPVGCQSLWSNSISSLRSGCDKNIFGQVTNWPAYAMIFEEAQFSGRCVTIGMYTELKDLSTLADELNVDDGETWNNRIVSIRTFVWEPPAAELERCPLVA
jgi:hypothetical protein